ncbi:caspase family protein [Variovorax sp. dw_954]|uniref:caspase family protein n=1 Tax=Variovorax sp. dw_954 TaxID=2720078 RepID=UPI001BD4C227|nr:caspase family protein [Variovorax sp. dw_954]
MTSRLSRWLLGALLVAAALPVWSAQRALLVGVSELVNQPQALWLQAPRNDVALMREVLLKQGFAAPDITVLADGVEGAGLPDAQRIHEALGRLLERSRSGDFVLLYFSGHGTRLRDATKAYQEPDGLAENFLARDVRGQVGVDRALPGGVRDVEFDAWIGAFLARNVFVWSVFDTCSAASLTRSAKTVADAAQPADDQVRFRGIQVDRLVRGDAASAVAPSGAPPVNHVARARYVAFFASESHQVTPELRLPRKDRNGRPQGLLTWAVAEALQRKPATWRELYNGVLALYPPVIEELEARFPERELPSPVAEGNLDLPLFANSLQPLSTRPVWNAQRVGDKLTLAVGRLDGLDPRQPVRVLATLADGTVRVAPSELSEIALGSARLDVPPVLAGLAGATFWAVTPVDAPESVALRVRADKPLPAGMSLQWPTALRTVRDGDADVRWTDLGAGGHRLELLSPALGTTATMPDATLPDAAALRQRLQGLAQLKWLLQLNALAGDGQLDGFDALVEIRDGERLVRSAPAREAEAKLPPPAGAERASLAVRNTSGQSLDLVIVALDGRGATQAVFPEESSETNRFERGTPQAPAAKRFELPPLDGGARLLVLASPAAPWSVPRMFGLRGQEAEAALPEVRVRGLPQSLKERQVYAAMVRWPGEAPASR